MFTFEDQPGLSVFLNLIFNYLIYQVLIILTLEQDHVSENKMMVVVRWVGIKVHLRDNCIMHFSVRH